MPTDRPPTHYARFRRADLQMQTPLDRRHWRGRSIDEGGCGLPANPSDDQIDLAAQRYADRCLEIGLEVLGVTDHNLGDRDVRVADRFMASLRRCLGSKATAFPGFEIATQIGKGVHVLCLFDPGSPISVVSEVLTEIGLPPGDRQARGTPEPAKIDLDRLCEILDTRSGLVILAHPDRSSGVLDKATIKGWWAKGVVTDARLLCLEICEPRAKAEQRNDALAKVLRNDRDWARPHPIAAVCNSDCKRLAPEDGDGDESWIGKRWTWIKTGRPTIEGLRQAFLDHESRIAFPKRFDDLTTPAPGEDPARRRIVSIDIEGAGFLADQSLTFSPQFNAVIGGGGTGKSTLLEYLRRGLGAQSALPGEPPDRMARLDATIGSSTRITVIAADGAGPLTAVLTRSGTSATDPAGGRVLDLPTRFPVMYVGQRELYEIARSQAATRDVVDHLGRDDLADLDARAERITVQLAQLDQVERDLERDTTRLATIRAEMARTQATLDARSRLVEPLRRLEDLRLERRALESIDHAVESAISQLEQVADEIGVAVSLTDLQARSTPHHHDIGTAATDASAAIGRARDDVHNAARELRVRQASAPDAALRAEIERQHETARREYDAALSGAPGDSVETMQQTIEIRQAEAAEIERGVEAARERLGERPALLAQLRHVWTEQTEVRRNLADELNLVVPRTKGDPDQPYVEISAIAFGDIDVAVEFLAGQVPDRRSFNQADELRLRDCLAAHHKEGTSPLISLRDWLTQRSGNQLDGFSDARLETLRNALESPATDRFRVPDRISVTVYREDGSRIGELDDGLSIGQRCLAILTLLLARGDDPIIIDQPEEEMANEFIYREVVPLILRAKRNRQVIVATHNANIPVNADAELIVALEARADSGEVRGQQLKVPSAQRHPGGDVAVGPLDLAAVRLAVEDVMEGSEEAFRRRQRKYGF